MSDDDRENYLRCAMAAGIAYVADGVDPAPGPIERVEAEIVAGQRAKGMLIELRGKAEAVRAAQVAVVKDFRVLIATTETSTAWLGAIDALCDACGAKGE